MDRHTDGRKVTWMDSEYRVTAIPPALCLDRDLYVPGLDEQRTKQIIQDTAK